jgi:hypothetical protein
MSVPEFALWLHILREHFPASSRLGSFGVSWYPGKSQHRVENKLSAARKIGRIERYFLTISNSSPDETRPKVCVQGEGEAHFSLDPFELVVCYFGFAESDLEHIRGLLIAKEHAIRAAWNRFRAIATPIQQCWAEKLSHALR